MLKITIECEGTGAELRQELIAFLNAAPTIQVNPAFAGELAFDTVEQIADTPEVVLPAEPEKAPRKKRGQTAEQPAPVETSTEETPAAEPEVETPQAPVITIEQLTQKALDLNREGKKEQTKQVLKDFGAESLSLKGSDKPLKPEDYAAAWEKLNAL